MAADKKKAARLKAWLIFIDESGLLMAPLVQRSWAPRGHTPRLRQRMRHRRKASVIAALGIGPDRRRLAPWFRIHRDRSLKGPDVAAFVRHLRRHTRGPAVVVWDRLGAHRGAPVRRALPAASGWSLERLPPYAPELNPVEYLWSYLKNHRLANLEVEELEELTAAASRHGRSIQRQPRLLRAFIEHRGLSLRLR